MKFFLVSLLVVSGAFAKDYKFAGQDYPPFNYLENGKAAGAMVETVAAMCKITNDTCTVEIIPLKRGMAMLESGELHGVTALIKNAERDAFANYSPTIVKSDMIYVAANPKLVASSVADLKGLSIGAVAGSASSKIAANDVKAAGGGAKVIEESDNDTVVKKLANGRYSDQGAAIINEDVLSFLSKKNSVTNIKKLFSAKSDEFGIYFSKKSVDQAALDKFYAAIEQMKSNGELKAILVKHGFKN